IEGIEEYLKLERKIDKDYSTDLEEEEWHLVNKEYVVLGDVVLYKDATLTSDVIGSVKKDEIVKVYRQNDKGWSILLSKDGIVYIENKNIEEKIVVDEPDMNNGSDTDIKMYTTTDLNMRSEASSNSELLDVIKSGEEVIKLGESAGWVQVKYKDKVGYVSGSHLTEVKIEKKEVKLNVPPQGHIDPSKPMVALTFDDGPNAKSTPRILDTLEKYNVRATFFDLGSLMLRYPEIVKREAKLGEVGTHTYSHKNLNKLSPEELAEELRLSREASVQVLGYEPKLLRPPYGNANANVRAGISDMAIINWNVDSLDWKYRNKDLTLNEIDKFGDLDGKIILMHSIHEETAEAVEILVPDLLDRGYQVVSVSELAYYKGYTLETGTIYYGFK
ncbi:MAG: polysaccharide deacetylase family protein, partial [Bacilli bacterium]|nr:polysaccharide deacetylase family protein [Bacilli bacterium]